jgi:lipooligosaccharide transport system permease protein
LFSGTFYPITQLPSWLEPVAYVTPLFHGVELARKMALPGVGEPVVTDMPAWIHLLYLVVMAGLGVFFAIRSLDRRLRL